MEGTQAPDVVLLASRIGTVLVEVVADAKVAVAKVVVVVVVVAVAKVVVVVVVVVAKVLERLQL